MNDEKLFTESLSFIKSNLDITFDRAPQHLLDFWRLDDLLDLHKDDLVSTKQWAVFMYALLAYKKRKDITEFKIEIETFIDLFMNWQTILALAEVSLKSDIKIRPIKLFDFDNLNADIEILE